MYYLAEFLAIVSIQCTAVVVLIANMAVAVATAVFGTG